MWLQIWLRILGTFSNTGTYWNIINSKQHHGSSAKVSRQSTERQGFKIRWKLLQIHCGINAQLLSNSYKSWNTIAWPVHVVMTNSSSENNIGSQPSSSVFNSAQTVVRVASFKLAWDLISVSRYNHPSNLRFWGFVGFGFFFFKEEVELSEQSYTHEHSLRIGQERLILILLQSFLKEDLS